MELVTSIAALGVALVALVVALLAAWRLRTSDAGGTLPVSVDGRALAAQAERIAALEELTERLAGALDGAVTRVGLVRYNAFDDVGGNQSFSLALLDGRADGVVISGHLGRGTTRVYVKAILDGRADGPLADEEVGALADAGLPDPRRM